jgi:hypothetical protein
MNKTVLSLLLVICLLSIFSFSNALLPREKLLKFADCVRNDCAADDTLDECSDSCIRRITEELQSHRTLFMKCMKKCAKSGGAVNGCYKE